MPRRTTIRAGLPLILAIASLGPAHGQQTGTPAADPAITPEWQRAAGGRMEFEVASVRLDTSSSFKPPSFPLSADDSYVETGGLFHADFPLVVYIQFAYKLSLTRDQIMTLLDKQPGWVSSDKFLIEARAEGHPTKDQFRLMVQSLLADRFGLKLHFEAREVPVFEVVLAKPGKVGPNLKPHSQGPPCEPSTFEASKTGEPQTQTFPAVCGAFAMRPLPNHDMELSSRNTTMGGIASILPSVADTGRPVIDRTGLQDHYDFRVEFSMEATRAQRSAADPAGAEVQGMPFIQAAEEQLGIKLAPGKAVLSIPVIDAIAKPAEN